MTKSKCYLVCSSVALHTTRAGLTFQARHYIGRTKRDVTERLADHTTCGQQHKPHTVGEMCSVGAARITAAMVRAGGVLIITRTWRGGFTEEKKLKAYGNAWRLCPNCQPRAMKRAPGGMTKGRKYKESKK